MGINNPKPFTADYADYADKSSYQNAPSGLDPTTTLGIRFIRAIRDGFFPGLRGPDLDAELSDSDIIPHKQPKTFDRGLR